MYASESSSPHYAVIEARWAGRPAERFALAYSSEESLRELIARPSIIRSGFMSRREALALIPNSFAVASDAVSKTEAICRAEDERSGARFGSAESQSRFTWQRIWMVPRRLMHQAAVAFLLIVCSKNVLSIALRAFLAV